MPFSYSEIPHWDGHIPPHASTSTSTSTPYLDIVYLLSDVVFQNLLRTSLRIGRNGASSQMWKIYYYTSGEHRVHQTIRSRSARALVFAFAFVSAQYRHSPIDWHGTQNSAVHDRPPEPPPQRTMVFSRGLPCVVRPDTGLQGTSLYRWIGRLRCTQVAGPRPSSVQGRIRLQRL